MGEDKWEFSIIRPTCIMQRQHMSKTVDLVARVNRPISNKRVYSPTRCTVRILIISTLFAIGDRRVVTFVN